MYDGKVQESEGTSMEEGEERTGRDEERRWWDVGEVSKRSMGHAGFSNIFRWTSMCLTINIH